MKSPYFDKPECDWIEITNQLVDNNPISKELSTLCLRTWQSSLNGKINTYLNLTIKDMSLSPRAVSNYFTIYCRSILKETHNIGRKEQK